MRHLSTLIAALLIAPLSWLLLAFGQDRSAQAFANAQDTGAFDSGDFVRPVMCLAGAGLLLGLLATLRFSPLGVVLTGAGYAAGYLGLLFDPEGVLGLFPQHLTVAGRSVDPTTPIRTGTALVLGALMVVAAVSVGRWRRWPTPTEEPEPPAGVEGAKEEPVDAEVPGPSRPAHAAPEPELSARYVSASRSGNQGPNSYEQPVNNSSDRWRTSGQSGWPYAQQPRSRAHDRRLDG
jgi:hypothetical protein